MTVVGRKDVIHINFVVVGKFPVFFPVIREFY